MTSRPGFTLERILAHSERVSLQPIQWRKLYDEQQATISAETHQRRDGDYHRPSCGFDASPAMKELEKTGTEPKMASSSSSSALKADPTITANEDTEDEDEMEQFKALNEPYIDLSVLSSIEPRYRALRLLKEKLIEDAKWCWANPSFPVLSLPPKSTAEMLGFYRDFVHKNTPCIIRGLEVTEWNKDWTFEQLCKVRGNTPVRINATPTGRGDAVIAMEGEMKVFVKPEERTMQLSDFIGWLTTERTEGHNDDDCTVLYLSAQNDSLRDEFSDLIREGFAPPSLPLGDALFGKRADAVNLWIGDDRAVSSMHRDTTYENLYCVLRGQKVFHLLPPCCAPFLRELPHPNAQYRFDGTEWHVDLEENDDAPSEGGMTPWIEIDVADPLNAMRTCPEFAFVADLVQRVEVNEGEVLFLPAGWFHRVTQSRPTVAVNYWYDRDFNSTWLLTETMEQLVEEFSKNGS